MRVYWTTLSSDIVIVTFYCNRQNPLLLIGQSSGLINESVDVVKFKEQKHSNTGTLSINSNIQWRPPSVSAVQRLTDYTMNE